MEDFVTFEIAKKLKEKGFDIPCMDVVNKFGCRYKNGWCEYLDDRDDEFITLKDLNENDYLLPTISQVLKWLRDEKGIHITICVCGDGWFYEVIHISSGKSLIEDYEDDMLQSYEDATIAGIEYVINNLI